VKNRRAAVVITIAACVVIFALLLRVCVPNSRKTPRAGAPRTAALTWMSSPDANPKYAVYRLDRTCPASIDVSGFTPVATAVTTVNYADAGLADGTYCYAVTTMGGATTTESVPISASLQLATPTTPANPPRQLLVNEMTVAWCANAALGDFVAAGPCSQGPITYGWTGIACKSTPSTLCSGMTGATPVQVKLDPQGAYTLLIGYFSAAPYPWAVGKGQTVDLMISGTVTGSTKNANWPHDQLITGDGRVDEITTVLCGANCIKANGISHTFCDSTSCVNANDLNGGTYNNGTYDFTIEFKLSGGTAGTATLKSLGTHLAP
jgi:hypothetical protein